MYLMKYSYSIFSVYKSIQNNISFAQSLGYKLLRILVVLKWGFPGGTSGEGLSCQCRRHRDVGWISGLGRALRGGHGSPFQYSCLETPMDGGAWEVTVHRVANESDKI